MAEEQASQYKVFVGGLTWDLTDDELRQEFDEFNATKAEILVDKMTQRSRGFGFVWFNSLKGMESAIKNRHGSKIKDREISVKEAIPEDKIPPGGRQRDRYRGSYGGGSRAGYDRGGYDRGGYGGYDRGGYDRGGYGGDYYRDPYYGGGYGSYGGGYDSRGGYDRSGYGGYAGYGGGGGGGYSDSRGYGGGSSYGPDRGSSRAAPRPGPYDRR